MSKQIKQMEMDALKSTFTGVRDLVVLSIKGLSCQNDNQMRQNLRKRNIRLQVVKNSLARRVFEELEIEVPKDSPWWQGPTVMAWGAGSLAELSREVDGYLKKNAAQVKDKVAVKGAVAEGQPVSFDQALRMPTRLEAIGEVLALILGPGSQLASQLLGPASQVAGQIKTLADKTEMPPEAAPAYLAG
jgi:large subunit ribosomal protein L10